mmetsp:Transcript_49129/g.117082  ORF Transcript_49129/g.117082 Transcript_49129/m.117082 type:complete len:247 (-) Transcript_49129:293-1033(-)
MALRVENAFNRILVRRLDLFPAFLCIVWSQDPGSLGLGVYQVELHVVLQVNANGSQAARNHGCLVCLVSQCLVQLRTRRKVHHANVHQRLRLVDLILLRDGRANEVVVEARDALDLFSLWQQNYRFGQSQSVLFADLAAQPRWNSPNRFRPTRRCLAGLDLVDMARVMQQRRIFAAGGGFSHLSDQFRVQGTSQHVEHVGNRSNVLHPDSNLSRPLANAALAHANLRGSQVCPKLTRGFFVVLKGS